MTGPQPVTRIFPIAAALPEIPLCPPFLKGGWGGGFQRRYGQKRFLGNSQDFLILTGHATNHALHYNITSAMVCPEAFPATFRRKSGFCKGAPRGGGWRTTPHSETLWPKRWHSLRAGSLIDPRLFAPPLHKGHVPPLSLQFPEGHLAYFFPDAQHPETVLFV